MKKLVVILFALMFLLGVPAKAQMFTLPFQNGNKLSFNVVDTTARRVEVTQPGAMIGIQLARPSGSLEIPSEVTYKGVTYTVVAIREKAFATAEDLTFVSIPSSVEEIGAQAFAGCTCLKGVVFPASQPTIDPTAFEGCKALRLISFGSDWKSVDLALFAQSETLESVFIPARVTKLTNLKLLKSLQRIDVDGNNPAFSSIDGLLYSRDAKTLYACPCARVGALVVPEGTESVLDGAFNGCEGLSSITFPWADDSTAE